MNRVGGISYQRKAVFHIRARELQPQGVGPHRATGRQMAQMVAKAQRELTLKIRCG
jgi:hypothetical protein